MAYNSPQHMNSPQHRVAVAQSAPAATADEAVEKIASLSRQAVGAGADLVLLPDALHRGSTMPVFDTDSTANSDGDDIGGRGRNGILDLGTVLAGPNYNGEALLTATIDLRDTIRGKFDFDVTGHYARPDVFRLLVNEADAPPVSFADGFPD